MKNNTLFITIIFISISLNCSLRVKRLIGGQVAERGQFPYIVSIHSKKNNVQFCAGVIIDRRYVLTAAHCLEIYSANNLYITVGSIKLFKDAKIYYVNKSIIHRHYNNITFENDIGLLKLTKRIKLTKYIKKIPLGKNEPPDNAEMNVAGWGLLFQKSHIEITTRNLHFMNITKMSLNKCNQLIRMVDKQHPVTKKHMCTNNVYYIGFCEGDSGGPLIYNNEVVGIVSWALGCATGYPDIYINVPAYYSWIKTQIQIHNS